MRGVRRGRRRHQGQSLAELSLVAPLLILLLLAAGQFGAILFGAISLDTATRDGARAAAQQPYGSGAFSGAPNMTNCTPVSAGANPVCQAVCEAAGGKPATVPSPSCTGAGLTINVTGITVNCTSYTATGCTNPSPIFAPCTSSWPNGIRDGYISVTATYEAPIFIPILGGMLADKGNSSVRTLQETVTTRVEPCSITQGS